MKSLNDLPTMHIAVAFDKNYLRPFYALASSVFFHNNSEQIKIHAIATGVSDQIKAEIEQYVNTKGGSIQFYHINESLVNKFILTNNWTHAVYHRILFPQLLDNKIIKFLYLDSDVIVIQSLRELYAIDTEQYPVAAVYDNYVKTQPLLGILAEGEYFNSGVLLINNLKWKEQRISEQTLDYLKNYPEKIKFVDQCGLNAVLKGNWKKIENKYNLIYSYLPTEVSKQQLKRFINNKVIIHFTLHRPWNMLCQNRLDYLYHYYLRQTPIGKGGRRYTDFSWVKIPAFLKIRILNFYFDTPVVVFAWKLLRRIINKRNHFIVAI